MKGRIFSGVQPTGNLHLGNYLGAIKNWVELQKEFECIYCVVDLHAITIPRTPKEIHEDTLEVTAGLIASGIDPSKSVLFNQSQVPHHSELAWIFNCTAKLGWLNRMTQFKEKAGKNRENASVGLYVYPTLMAADILAYKATHVPVGQDQKQHLELTRDIASAFNSSYVEEFFPLPEPQIFDTASRVMSLRDGLSKMSKSDASDYSRINLRDSIDEISLKFKKAKSDPNPLPYSVKEFEDRHEAKNLVGIYSALSKKTETEVLNEFGGKGFGAFKPALADLAVSVLEPINHDLNKLLEDTPNPLTIKFLPGKEVMKSGTADFRKKELSENSPLASRLFEIEGVDGVFLGSDFISVTKKKDEEWFSLKPSILGKIMEHYASGDEVLILNSIEKEEDNTDESDTVQQIKKLLETRVRPAVAMDGGDIQFESFEDGIVTLLMKGACSGCPSSTATLKMGIENMLRHYIPEVQEVRASGM